jgi:hypothetical protein
VTVKNSLEEVSDTTWPTRFNQHQALDCFEAARMATLAAVALPLALPPENGTVLREVQEAGEVRVFCATWNMHGKVREAARRTPRQQRCTGRRCHIRVQAPAPVHLQPAPADLSALLPVNRYHVYAIGSQECERPIAQSVVFPSKERWEKQLAAAMGPAYFTVAAGTLGAVHLVVFAHIALRPVITDCQTGSVPCGFANAIPTKGGVAIGFNIGSTSLLLINSHLAAFQHNVEARHANYRRIEAALPLAPALYGLEARLRIAREAEKQLAEATREARAAAPTPAAAGAGGAAGAENDDDEDNGTSPTASPLATSPPVPAASPTPDTAVSSRYDRVVFMGDMNYRVDCSREEADEALRKGDRAVRRCCYCDCSLALLPLLSALRVRWHAARATRRRMAALPGAC